MSRPGVDVSIIDSAPPPSALIDSGLALIVGVADKGPGAARLIQSMSGYEAAYGVRSATSAVLWDALDCYFREGGKRAVISRVLGPAAVAASKIVKDGAGTPKDTVKVSASSTGAW